jgi:hypothetical protein
MGVLTAEPTLMTLQRPLKQSSSTSLHLPLQLLTYLWISAGRWREVTPGLGRAGGVMPCAARRVGPRSRA